jgi:hypothetical protein
MKKLVVIVPPPAIVAMGPPVDGARAYHLRAEGAVWASIDTILNCPPGASKDAAERYANSRGLYVFK